SGWIGPTLPPPSARAAGRGCSFGRRQPCVAGGDGSFGRSCPCLGGGGAGGPPTPIPPPGRGRGSCGCNGGRRCSRRRACCGASWPAQLVVKRLRAIISGNVLWLGIVSLLNDAASDMIFPLLPVFLVQTLGAGPAFLGLVEGIAESTSSLVKLAGGWLSDRSGRRKALIGWGYGAAGVVRPLIALATAPWHVLAVRFTDRLGKGLRTAPRDALLAESVEPERRGTAFGIHRAADHAGAVLGPLLATGILLLAPGQVRLVFALAAVPAALAVLLLVWKVHEGDLAATAAPHRPGEAGGGGDNPSAASFDPGEGGLPHSPAPGGASPGLPRSFRTYLTAMALFTLGNASDAFLLLRAEQVG